MTLLSIIGARPQFIKIAALQRAIIMRAGVTHLLLHTGQHYDHNMSGAFFDELNIPRPDFLLPAGDRNDSSSVSRMTDAIEQILCTVQPAMVIVYGDTNSTLAGALAAKRSHCKLAHVEAGLRSYNDAMPEEANRVQTDRLSDLLFCPTLVAKNNLLKEGFQEKDHRIIVSGDLMLDAMSYYSQNLPATVDKMTAIPQQEFLLCTLHRQSLVTSREKLSEVIQALNKINRQIPVILPAHPRLKSVVGTFGLHVDFNLLEPVGYLQMIFLLKHCRAVITDSGGLQKEAYFCRKPCVTVRNETEWTELVAAGVNFLAGDSSAAGIVLAFGEAMNAKKTFDTNFYGFGNSAEIIVDSILEYLQNR